MKSYWKLKGVKSVSPLPLFGNYYRVLFPKKPLANFITDLYNAFPNERYNFIDIKRGDCKKRH